MIEWRDAPGRPVVVGDRTITPVARSISAQWPGGGFVSNRPAAVIVEREEGSEQIPIRDLNTRLIWAIAMGAAALIAVAIARDRGRRKSHG